MLQALSATRLQGMFERFAQASSYRCVETIHRIFDLPGLFIKNASKSAKSAALQGISGRRYLSDAATSV
jgi:hypothetical protein